jgi:hypothetical protein
MALSHSSRAKQELRMRPCCETEDPSRRDRAASSGARDAHISLKSLMNSARDAPTQILLAMKAASRPIMGIAPLPQQEIPSAAATVMAASLWPYHGKPKGSTNSVAEIVTAWTEVASPAFSASLPL